MNSIFKSSLGFHIDLSKIVAIGTAYTSLGRAYFNIDVQLMDKPIIVDSSRAIGVEYDIGYPSEIERFDKEVRQELIDAWIEYSQPANPTPYYPLGMSIPCAKPEVDAETLLIDTCDFGHKFAKLSDHPMRDGNPRCPHCMAIGLDRLI